MTVKLRELIKNFRQCKTASEERKVIAKECAHIRTSFAEDEAQYRRRNIAKLLFIHMLGFPTAFGQMECLKLIATNSYGSKRMGYLGLMLLLDERQEVLMLVTNSLKNDLNHSNQYVVGLGLCSLANISSPSIARDLASEVIKLLQHNNEYIRKKAALCAIRVVRKVPELLEQFVPKVRPLLMERNHGVLITAVTLMIEICLVEPEHIKAFRRAVPHLVKILKSLVLSGYAPEHDVNGVTDPFLQTKVLRLLRLLGKGDSTASDAMNDILAQVATNTENTRNVGNAILYECVQTIMSIESESGLRVLAINILGRFLLNRDNNIRYVALNTLKKVVSIDQQAVQRHRSTVVDCLKDHDISIRKRALDLTYALVNASNVKALVRELLNYLLTADMEFRAEITGQICVLTEKFAPSPKWRVDTILKVMTIAGNYIQDETVANTVHLIMNTPDLQAYAVHKLYAALSKDIVRQPLVRTGVWVIGEFGDLLLAGGKEIAVDDILLLLDSIARHPASEIETREFVLTALVKLTDRMDDPAFTTKIEDLLSAFRSSLTVEVQQRACEYHSLLTQLPAEQRAVVLEHVPPKELDEEEAAQQQQQQQAAAAAAPASTPGEAAAVPAARDAPAAVPAAAAPAQDLLSLLGSGSKPAEKPADLLSDLLSPSSPAAAPAAQPSPGGGLLDLLGGPAPQQQQPQQPQPQQQPQQPQQQQAAGGQLPPTTVFEKSGVKIVFSFAKQPNAPNVTLINAVTTNATPVALNNYTLQAAVPNYMKIQLAPASGNMVPPGGAGSVSQQMKIANSLYGQKPPAIRLKIDFVVNGRAISDSVTVTNLPQGV